MKQIRVEKRLPYGFLGTWGKLYKRYTTAGSAEVKTDEFITYEKNHYRDIGQDVQFKRSDETNTETEQPIRGLVAEAEYTVAETTDAYYDDVKNEYACVVSTDDIVRVFGRYWMVTGVRIKYKYTPAAQAFYYLDLKRIL